MRVKCPNCGDTGKVMSERKLEEQVVEAIKEIRKDARTCEEKIIQVIGALNQLELNLTNLAKGDQEGQPWKIPFYNPGLGDKL